MQSIAINQALSKWPEVAELVYVPHSEDEYTRLVTLLDHLIDEVGENETHALASLMEIVGVLVKRYEDEHVSELA
jgi:HTH-type transcriptional regulator / antitoxin HigA